MAATEHGSLGGWVRRLRCLLARRRARRPASTLGPQARARLAAAMRGVLAAASGALAAGGAAAATLAEDKAEAIFHVYDGGGVRATGPAFLVRKGLSDSTALSGSYYVDAVSNASIDVVTTASPFKERRTAWDLGVEHVVRDATLSFSLSRSDEPDYIADSYGVDVSQEVFGGMTTVSLGFSRGHDEVGQKGVGFFDTARHWSYRLGATQILSPTWLASANFEIVADDGYLGSPYRVARVFGAAVPERHPRTRSSRAIKLRAIGAHGTRGAMRGEYRYFWDNWDISAHTAELGYARYVGESFLVDGFLRYHTQGSALFYSDNATAESTYISRNRQLSAFRQVGLGAKATYTLSGLPAPWGVQLTGAYEFKQFRFSEFTDLRDGGRYGYNAHVLQLTVSATF